jgi:ferredoxin
MPSNRRLTRCPTPAARHPRPYRRQRTPRSSGAPRPAQAEPAAPIRRPSHHLRCHSHQRGRSQPNASNSRAGSSSSSRRSRSPTGTQAAGCRAASPLGTRRAICRTTLATGRSSGQTSPASASASTRLSSCSVRLVKGKLSRCKAANALLLAASRRHPDLRLALAHVRGARFVRVGSAPDHKSELVMTSPLPLCSPLRSFALVQDGGCGQVGRPADSADRQRRLCVLSSAPIPLASTI